MFYVICLVIWYFFSLRELLSGAAQHTRTLSWWETIFSGRKKKDFNFIQNIFLPFRFISSLSPSVHGSDRQLEKNFSAEKRDEGGAKSIESQYEWDSSVGGEDNAMASRLQREASRWMSLTRRPTHRSQGMPNWSILTPSFRRKLENNSRNSLMLSMKNFHKSCVWEPSATIERNTILCCVPTTSCSNWKWKACFCKQFKP